LNVISLIQDFKELEERINQFIKEDSSLEYLEGSKEVVDGGAFAWSKLKLAESIKQDNIDADYMDLAEKVRAIMKVDSSPDIEKFESSYELVLNYIRQDTLLWVPGLKSVLDSIKSELDLQQLFLAAIDN
jgi:hypothetical protein